MSRDNQNHARAGNQAKAEVAARAVGLNEVQTVGGCKIYVASDAQGHNEIFVKAPGNHGDINVNAVAVALNDIMV